MLQMKDLLQTPQGIIEVPSYNGTERAALKAELFRLANVDQDIEKKSEEEDKNPKNDV